MTQQELPFPEATSPEPLQEYLASLVPVETTNDQPDQEQASMDEQEWLTSTDPERMLGYIKNDRVVPWVSDRKLRLFACACCRDVWHLLTDEQSRQAVEVAERFADGKAKLEELAAAWDVAWAATWAAARAAAWAATGPKQVIILRDIVGNPFRPVTPRITQPNRWVCVHCKAVIYMPPRESFGACECGHWKWRQTTELDEWLTPTVLSLAQAAYDERAGQKCEQCGGSGELATSHKFDCYDCHGTGTISNGTLDPDRLAVLSDALEEAGCDNVELLMHLRGKELILQPKTGNPPLAWYGPKRSPCYRGCWALDLILGKESIWRR